jgi:putative membrane protein
MEANQYLHEVAITAIVVKNGRYLIVRRSPNKKRFPGMWTVPGGRLEPKDYTGFPKDTENWWYRVLERTLAREVKEEVGIEIENVRYLTSLARVHEDGAPSLVISCVADYAGGNITLQEGETDDFAWVSLEESEKYKLIDGIDDELVLAEEKFPSPRRGGAIIESIMKIIFKLIIYAVAIVVIAKVVPGIMLTGLAAAVAVAIVWALVNLFIKPIILLFALPIEIITLGLFSFIVNAFLFWLVGDLVPGFAVTSITGAFLGSIILTLVQWLCHLLLD